MPGSATISATAEAFGDPDKVRRDAMISPQRETAADDDDERNDQRFDITESLVLKKQDEQHIERGDAHAREQWEPEEANSRRWRIR